VTGDQIRQSFLDFFKERGHTIVPSAPLVPEDDPSLLFTNAGMVQFKQVFLGHEGRPYVRAVDSQKCLRISGKHNDLEQVGRDTYHHTFFEMLGNWSFGDYYKREAIGWAWELLTAVWKLPKDRLFATVHTSDDESARLWTEVTDLPAARVLRFDAENFWEMAETGPCGPCSEVHIDRGPDACDRRDDPAHRCGVNAGCARYIELWNLVFIQYDRDAKGKLTELPAKHVDTGMGFERVCAVLQNQRGNYETDILRAIIASAERLAGKRYGASDRDDVSLRVIADHGRAVTFLVADGVLPSNEGRGYVLRRLLRRGARHGKLLGLNRPFLHEVVGAVVRTMGRAYPEIVAQQRRCGTNTVQLCDRVTDGSYAELRAAMPGVSIVQVIHVNGRESVQEAINVAPHVDALLLDSGNQKLATKELGGTGRTHDWRLSAEIRRSVRAPVFLAGGLRAENLRDAIDQVDPWGVDLCSGLRSDGRLDPSKLKAFMLQCRS